MAELPPLGTREEFMAELTDLAKETAPSVFALCEEVGDRVCGHVQFWGMALEDNSAEIISVSRGFRGSFQSAESALNRLSTRRKLHLIWV